MQMSMNAYGISLGASTISAVEVSRDESRINVNRTLVRAHEGNPRAVLVQVLDELDCGDAPILVTGRKFRHFTSLPSVTEPEATESALRFISDGYLRRVPEVGLGALGGRGNLHGLPPGRAAENHRHLLGE
jgi:hypothetical protein